MTSETIRTLTYAHLLDHVADAIIDVAMVSGQPMNPISEAVHMLRTGKAETVQFENVLVQWHSATDYPEYRKPSETPWLTFHLIVDEPMQALAANEPIGEFTCEPDCTICGD